MFKDLSFTDSDCEGRPATKSLGPGDALVRSGATEVLYQKTVKSLNFFPYRKMRSYINRI